VRKNAAIPKAIAEKMDWKSNGEKSGKSRQKSVLVCDLENNSVQRFESGKEAAKILGVNPIDISACLRGKQKTIKRKWTFKYDK
jgi:hypothetical protein